MDFFNVLKNINSSKENVVITIVSGENIGSKLILSDREILYKSNNEILWDEIIQNIPENEKSQQLTVNNQKVYYEFLRHSYKVVVCGAGHISISIIKMCKLLDLPVTVIDDRIPFVNNAIASGADKSICEPFENALNNIQGDAGTFFIIVTRGHRYDQICLEKIIHKENAYIGMIGSRLRVAKVLDYLEEKGLSREKLDKVYTPIGLKIGAETPAEIAVAIIAEIIEVKNKKTGLNTYNEELIEFILNEKSNIPKALVTIVSRKGSSPRDVGTKMIVSKDGKMVGTIGGGCVEADIRQTALSCMDRGKCKLVRVDMTGIEAEDDGMVCGGIIELFVEPIN